MPALSFKYVYVQVFQGYLYTKVAVHLDAQMPQWAAYTSQHTHTHTHWSPVVGSVSAPGQSFHATFPPLRQTSTSNPSFWTHKWTLYKHTHTHIYKYIHFHSKLQTFTSSYTQTMIMKCFWLVLTLLTHTWCICPVASQWSGVAAHWVWAGNSCSTW